MDEEKRGESTRKKNTRARLFGRVITVLVTLALVVMAILVVIYRDRLSSEGLRSLLGRTVDTQEDTAPFTYENGADQSFALAGNGLAVASGSGIQLLNEKGETVAKAITSMDTPAVSASESLALFYDIGGSTVKALGFDGSCTDVDAGKSVITASVNDAGYFAVISEESGSKGLVQVFDPSCQLLYQWYSGTGYPLSAQVGPDNKSLAVLCLTSEGSVIHFFKLSSEDEQASVSVPGVLLFELCYVSGGRVAAIGSETLVFADSGGALAGQYDFAGRYLSAYDFGGSGFVALCLSEYRAGAGGTLLTIDTEGSVLGQSAVEGDLLSLSASGRQLLFTTSGGLTLYSQSMQLLESEETLVTAKKALLRPKGDVLLLSSYSAEPFDF